MALGRLRSVTTIFAPAAAGAGMQLIAVGFITILFYLLVCARYFASGWPVALCDPNTACQAATPLMRLSYLMTAAGVALTNNRFIGQATLWARQSSQLMLPSEPRFSAEAVAFQLSIVLVACAVEELEAPSQFAVTLGRWMGGLWLGVILWPAMWSIAVAALGSLIHALYLSARKT